MTRCVLDLSLFDHPGPTSERGHDLSSSGIVPHKNGHDPRQNCPPTILSLALIPATMGTISAGIVVRAPYSAVLGAVHTAPRYARRGWSVACTSTVRCAGLLAALHSLVIGINDILCEVEQIATIITKRAGQGPAQHKPIKRPSRRPRGAAAGADDNTDGWHL
jgi:hypothetical protein